MGVLLPPRSKYSVGEELVLRLGAGTHMKVIVLEVFWNAENEQVLYKIISRVMNPDLDDSQIVTSYNLMRVNANG